MGKSTDIREKRSARAERHHADGVEATGHDGNIRLFDTVSYKEVDDNLFITGRPLRVPAPNLNRREYP
ncbi:MAG TPA: hypothetical protein VMI73_22675 [Trebonia sp.]|nr:hypothetical protein [Trebonia sp.]